MPRTRMLLTCVAFALAGTAACANAAEPVPAACDAPTHATVLHAAARTAADARAYWLDRQYLLWPQASGPGRFRLYYSATARLQADPDKPVGGSDGHVDVDSPDHVPAALAKRFAFAGDGVELAVADGDLDRIPDLLRQQVLLVREDDGGRVLDATYVQLPGALDDLHVAAVDEPRLGATPGTRGTGFRLWAPTARSVSLCIFDGGDRPASAHATLRRDATGVWSTILPVDLSGKY